MAHELGHVTLGHALARSKELVAICEQRLLVTDCFLTPEVFFRPYGPEREKAADRYAADLLRQVSSSGCSSLVVLIRRAECSRRKVAHECASNLRGTPSSRRGSMRVKQTGR